ncbi:uncharacterized protein V1513DRAFT_440499 [Lipomyces chichibuensis]|uniref:uncharacterized protein n=1 Tax=Lipomyces chichibuensis TaxID=1546026 RepID=UPI0033438F08
MPRAPRRRKINLAKSSTRAVNDTISVAHAPDEKVIPPSVETSTQSTVATLPIPSSGLPSSPPVRGNRKKHELVIADSEDEDAILEILQEEDGGADELNLDDSAFLPRTTSTPKSAVPNIATGIQQQQRVRRGKPNLLSQEIHASVSLSGDIKEGEEDIDADNRSIASSQSSMSDPFGFDKIRGIRIVKPVSSSASPMSSAASNASKSKPRSRPLDSAQENDSECTHHKLVDPGTLSSPLPPSSPLSELGKTPSPAKAFITSFESPRDPDSPILVGRNSASEKSTAVGKKRKKNLRGVTTAQLTELLPKRLTRRRRQMTQSLHFDESTEDDSDEDASVDGRPIMRRKDTRSKQTQKKRVRRNKENLETVEVSKKRGQKSKPVQRKPLHGTINCATRHGNVTDRDEDRDDAASNVDIDDDFEQSPDSEALREMESERLRKKFKEVDEWDLEVETVPVGSDSSFL